MAGNDTIEVGWGDRPSDVAVLLLAAATDVGEDAGVVKTTGRRSFTVPRRVHDAYVKAQQSSAAEAAGETRKPAAKRSAKKSASKE